MRSAELIRLRPLSKPDDAKLMSLFAKLDNHSDYDITIFDELRSMLFRGSAASFRRIASIANKYLLDGFIRFLKENSGTRDPEVLKFKYEFLSFLVLIGFTCVNAETTEEHVNMLTKEIAECNI